MRAGIGWRWTSEPVRSLVAVRSVTRSSSLLSPGWLSRLVRVLLDATARSRGPWRMRDRTTSS